MKHGFITGIQKSNWRPCSGSTKGPHYLVNFVSTNMLARYDFHVLGLLLKFMPQKSSVTSEYCAETIKAHIAESNKNTAEADFFRILMYPL
jgi:hypothetical protein